MASDFSGGFQRSKTGAADQVLADLRARILSGDLARGTRLPSEKELSAYYGVSGPTIREAIRALSAMSLVEVRHGSGTYIVAKAEALMHSAMDAVVELEGVDLLGILDLSEVLYQQVVSLAIDVAGEDGIAELRQTLAEADRAVGTSGFAEALREFLLKFVALSRNPLLVAMASYLVETQIGIVRSTIARSLRLSEEVGGGLRDYRGALVNALERRDLEGAKAAASAYVDRGRELVRENELVREELVRGDAAV